VPKGGVLDFVLDTCPFSDATDSQTEWVVVNVRFSDFEGRQGLLSATAMLERQPPSSPELQIDLFAAERTRSGNFYVYDPHLILRETAGYTAEIIALTFTVPNGAPDTNCVWVSPTISGGQSWNISAMGYCRPYAYSQTPETSVTMYLTYRGSDRVMRTLSQTVEVSP
jgi:hypothetical protein